MTLPSSYIISGHLARFGDGPIALGGSAEMWEGTHNGGRVCIKVLYVTQCDSETPTKVRILLWCVFLCRLRNTRDATVILQRGHHMEQVEAPECCSFHRRYKGTLADCVGVDAERNFDELHQGKSGREPHQSS